MKDVVFNFHNRNFLLVGASSGIGYSIAEDIAAAGGSLLVVARRENRLNEIKDKYPKQVSVAVLDVESATADDWDSMISEFVKEHGKFSGVVYTAGISDITPLKYFSIDYAKRMMDVSFWGMVNCIQSISKKKYSNNNMSAVVFSSVYAHYGEKGMFAYSAAKAAVITGMKSIAKEIGKSGRRINSISPAWIDTEMTRKFSLKTDILGEEEKYLLGTGKVTDVSGMVMFLLSDASRWITGCDYIIDGGFQHS